MADLFEARSFVERAAPDVVITNPPFRLAREVLEFALELDTTVVLLLRLNFLASASRAELMRHSAPDVYVIPNRPSFSGGGKTDSIEYAWFVWPKGAHDRATGRVQVLAPTSVSDRRAR